MAAREVLRTERLVLRELLAEDAPFMLELMNEPGFLKHIGDRGVRSLADAEEQISRQLQSYAERGYGMWAAVRSDVGPVGLAGLVRREGLDHPDVGYALLSAFEGHGYATEAARAVLQLARERLGMTTVAAITSLDNRASIAVLERIGFRFIGIRRLPGKDERLRYFEA